MKKGQHPRKWSKEQKLEIIGKHLNEHISIKQLEREYDADHSMIARWVRNYDEYGEKALAVEYKKYLEDKDYATRSINSMLASINAFLKFVGLSDCTVRSLKQQKESFCSENRELTKAEYMKLLSAAKGKEQL